MWNSTGLSGIGILVCADYMRRAYMLTEGVDGWRNEKVARCGLILDLDDRASAAMRVDGLGQQLLTEVDLRFGVIDGVALVLDHLEPQMVERAAHIVEPVLGLDDDLVEPVRHRPLFLLLGKRAEKSLAAPVAPRAANPGEEHAPAVEVDVVAEPVDEVDQFGFGLGRLDLVRDFERHRHDRSGIV